MADTLTPGETNPVVTKFQINGVVYDIDVNSVRTIEDCNAARDRALLAAAQALDAAAHLNKVTTVDFWGPGTTEDLPTPTAEGLYAYLTTTQTLFISSLVESELQWVVEEKRENTLYVDITRCISYVYKNGVMVPISIEKESTHVETTVSILPNVLNKWGSVQSLAVSFVAGEQGCVNEYQLEFTVDSDEFTLTLPRSVRWASEPSWESGYTYQVSILNNLAIYAEWEDANA